MTNKTLVKKTKHHEGKKTSRQEKQRGVEGGWKKICLFVTCN